LRALSHLFLLASVLRRKAHRPPLPPSFFGIPCASFLRCCPMPLALHSASPPAAGVSKSAESVSNRQDTDFVDVASNHDKQMPCFSQPIWPLSTSVSASRCRRLARTRAEAQ
jgi:hypothetical protein